MWSVVEGLSFCRVKFFFLLGEIHFSVDLLKVDFGQISQDKADIVSAAGSLLKSWVNEFSVSPLE